ncbi:T9SS type A sorting domain-containing protein [Polaribacter sp.]|uniref:T9SS type A sorting domain-containing protein n=1 Tax=Polaribacter sp. TaxID=1920175 RepID=UPI003F6C5ABA
MKQKNILKIAIFFFLALSFSSISAQIYDADFSNDGDGFADHTTSSPLADAPASVGPFGSAGNQWSLSYTSKPSTDGSANSFKVVDGALVSDDWGGQGIFQSQSIDVSSINTVDISAISQNSGANDDNFTYFYILDGGSRVETSIGVTNNGDPVNYSISGLDVTGINELVVGFEFDENGGGDGYTTSSFTVTDATISGPTVGFDAESSTTQEANTPTAFNIPLTMVSYTAPITVTGVINGGSAEVSDYTFTTNSVSFTANETKNLVLTINDDADFDDETIIIDISVTSGTADLGTSTHTVTITDDDTPPAPSLIISEIADTADDADGRFVEIYNNGESTIDFSITPIYISRFTNGNPVATSSNVEELTTGTLAAGHYLVIAASGTNFTTLYGYSPNEINGGFAVNGDDPFGMYSGTYPDGTLFDVYGEIGVDGTGQSWEYEDSRAIRNSISDSPSTTWQASSWTISSTNVADATPGASENEFRYDGEWKPRDVYTNATSSDNILVSASVSITNNLEVNNFEVTNSAVVTINSGTALKVNGTASGNVTYNTTLATTNWYLMSSPTNGVIFDSSFVEDNNIDDTSSTNGNIGIGEYNPADNDWSYLQSSGSISSTSGKGYSIKQDVAGTISFTGSINTENVTVTGLNTTGFNLLGNPYTAYKATQTFLDGNEQLDQQGIWVWNQANGNYEVKVKGENFTLAPTQGFFVKSNGASQVQIFENNQSLTGNAFQKTAISQVKLFMNDGKNQRFAKLYYKNNATIGYDVGWEGEVFTGIPNALEVFTTIVNRNDGKKYQVQSLPDSKYDNMIIPIGVIADGNKKLTFTSETVNLPAGINVYLEDREKNTFTRLDGVNANYKVTLTESLNGTGRFYLHTKSSSVLSSPEDLLKSVSIYQPNPSTLRIAGLTQGETSLELFNILGKQVLKTSFAINGVKDVSLPNLASGMYIVKLSTEAGSLNKKITLE